MLRTFCLGWVVLALMVAPGLAAEGKYSIKLAATPIPKELAEGIAKLMSDRSVQLLDDKGKLMAELWLRKEVPAIATPAQLKNGLTYRELEETTLVGAMRIDQQMLDYRKQKIKPGVYTLRVAYQPQDGDHMGTAPYTEFGLLSPAAEDKNPGPHKEAKELHEVSTKATGTSHPGVLLLFPNEKPKDTPELVSKPNGHWVLNFKVEVNVKDQKTTLGMGLNLIGHAE